MENIHLAGESEDDLYSGFNVDLDATALQQDEAFQHAVRRTSHGRRPPPTGKIPIGQARLGTASRQQRGSLPSSMGRPTTGAAPADGARPMTAVRAAGFSSQKGAAFDPMGQGQPAGPAPPLEQKNEDSPEEKIKLMEKKVNELIEESCHANSRGEYSLALEKAKEAGRKERMLVRQREALGGNEQVNLDLTYSILFNLANQYAANEMYGEALNTYLVIVKNKLFSNAGRLKTNMGNIYFQQKNYSKAVKFYRMALDQVPNTHKEMRIKIMQNIGLSFVKLTQYSDAITSFEHIMTDSPNFMSGFNLLLCYYAVGDKEKMKATFRRLLLIDLRLDDEDKYTMHQDDKKHNLIVEAIKSDSLRQTERDRKMEADRCIKTAAKLIAPVVESRFSAGYDWCIEQVRSSNYVDLSHELEVDKAIMYLKQRDFQQAAESLKAFEKKDTKVASTASTNLSFLYYLEKDLGQADKYADLALQADRYNPSALVNKGNVMYARNEFEKAREYYREALSIEASCVEALFNMGLSSKRLSRYEDAHDCFYKLHAILRTDAEVVYQIADIYEQLEDSAQATEWFMQLVTLVPTDPSILARLGEMCDSEGDKSQAFQYHYDSYRYFPSNIEIIEWLGAYYIDSQFCEKAIAYFERASIIQPNQVKWQLMIASCHRRSGNYQQAFETYKHIHRKFPDNIECLKFLVRLCTDLGLKDAQDYANKLKKAEKAKEIREQRTNSGTKGQRSRNSSAGSASADRQPAEGGDRKSSSRGARTSAGAHTRNRSMVLEGEDNEPYQATNNKGDIDVAYNDPLGPQVERPKTAARRKDEPVADEWADEELGDDLLPE